MTRVMAWVMVMALGSMATPADAAEEGTVEVEAAALLAEPEVWDGRRVAIVGELVGDYSPRAEGVWVQLNDDAFVETPVAAGGAPTTTNLGVGALIPSAEFSAVEGPPGRYGRVGPVVRLNGTFIHSDPVREGETYIRVENLTLLNEGQDFRLPGPDPWLPIGVLLILAAGGITWRSRQRTTDN